MCGVGVLMCGVGVLMCGVGVLMCGVWTSSAQALVKSAKVKPEHAPIVASNKAARRGMILPSRRVALRIKL
jgi:hypothetical protein